MGLAELKKHWEELLAGEGMPANIDQIGTRAKLHNGRLAPVVSYRECMNLPFWLFQSAATDEAAEPDPTAKAAEANLDNV